MGVIEAKYKEPKRTFKTVWAGIYGGHYDAIVFFKSRPKRSDEDYDLVDVIRGKYYDMYDNRRLTIGAMWLEDFKELYPDVDIQPYYERRQTEIVEVFQLNLEAAWDKDGELYTINLRADGY